MCCALDGPGATDGAAAADQLRPKGKRYLPFGGKAPRDEPPVVQVNPVPAKGAQAGAGEHKGSGDEEQQQPLTPPQQLRALSATCVRAQRTQAKKNHTGRKSAGKKHLLTDKATKDHTDLLVPSPPSPAADEVITIEARVLGNLHVQHAKDKNANKKLKDENKQLKGENLTLLSEVQRLQISRFS